MGRGGHNEERVSWVTDINWLWCAKDGFLFDVPSGSSATEKSPGGVTTFGTADFFPWTTCNDPTMFPLSCLGVEFAFMSEVRIFCVITNLAMSSMSIEVQTKGGQAESAKLEKIY